MGRMLYLGGNSTVFLRVKTGDRLQLSKYRLQESGRFQTLLVCGMKENGSMQNVFALLLSEAYADL